MNSARQPGRHAHARELGRKTPRQTSNSSIITPSNYPPRPTALVCFPSCRSKTNLFVYIINQCCASAHLLENGPEELEGHI
ncbi:hypothetical protein EYC84_010187 [Monilinia fructicola]|uniref:Uncharacterized protein n=1 Tax=Monilinia fructicola TaxID=38448 RepID=A0A5M9JEP2_MONFR|nr:hypothetical protein EYC84_010187 [Monilinia fructicola]